VRSVERFHIYEKCGESISIGIRSMRSLLGQSGMSDLIFGPKEDNCSALEEIEVSSDIQIFPDISLETNVEVHINKDFPQVDRLTEIINKYASVLFGHFDSEGLRVAPMDIELKPNSKIRVQPARFLNKELLVKVKVELDRLETWGVIEKVDDAEVASPLVVVKKPDGSIRLATDYQELNACIVDNANQLPMQYMLFQELF
jgi:hypothetical protein